MHTYVGMDLDYQTQSKAKITMFDYIKELLDDTETLINKGYATTPATNNLFSVGEETPRLTPELSYKYHQVAAKLLFLSKRACPDILTTVSYLTSRVQ